MTLPKFRVLNFPRTSTVLAIGVLAGCFVSRKMDWGDALLMVLTFYFTKHQASEDARPSKD